MRISRTSLRRVALWAAAAVLATAATTGVVTAARARDPEVVSVHEVDEELARISSTPTTGDGSNVDDSAGDGEGAVGGDDDDTDGSLAKPPPWPLGTDFVKQTYHTFTGQVTITGACASRNELYLDSWSPADGYTATVVTRQPIIRIVFMATDGSSLYKAVFTCTAVYGKSVGPLPTEK
jgi:hypothetical protein